MRIDNVRTDPPQYGVNYKRGYVGFTFSTDSIVSNGIAIFEHWDRKGEIPVSHTFLVAGDNQIIEATMPKVRRQTLDFYANDPHTLVFFRKPKGWSEAFADRAVAEAEKHIGDGYDATLIVSHALANTLTGKLLNSILKRLPERLVAKVFDSKKREICSELVSLALVAGYEGVRKGILWRPANTINPQALFEDDDVFEPWHK